MELEFAAWVSPLVLDLSGSGEEALFKPHPYIFHEGPFAQFDIDGDGFNELMEWIRPGFGLLITKPAGSMPEPVNGRDLLGTTGGYLNGFERLLAFDINQDGVVSGFELNFLTCGIDDGDALPEEGEWSSLPTLGIPMLRTIHEGVRGSFIREDQSEGIMWDWFPSRVLGRPAIR